MSCRERSSYSSRFEAFPLCSTSPLSPFEDVALHVGHTPSLICVCACVCVCACALLCQACQMYSCPLEEARTMRSIRAQLSNHRTKPAMHLMLGVVMETRGADFPLHWLPSVCRQSLKKYIFPRVAIERWEGKLVECSQR